jgi:hypothetical protein
MASPLLEKVYGFWNTEACNTSYVRIMAYMRLRLLVRILQRGGHWSADRAQLKAGLTGLRGNQDHRVWDVHYQNFLNESWSYLRPENW